MYSYMHKTTRQQPWIKHSPKPIPGQFPSRNLVILGEMDSWFPDVEGADKSQQVNMGLRSVLFSRITLHSRVSLGTSPVQ